MEDTKTALATTETGLMNIDDIGDLEGSMDRPKSLDPNDKTGIEGITADEVQLPRLAIAQGLSPQCVPGEGQYIQGLAIGQMFNDITETIYGNGPLTVVPMMRRVVRIEFDPTNKKVPLDREVPAGDDRLKWHGDVPPRATEYYEFISLVLRPGKAPEPLVVSIKTTNKQQKAAAKLWTTYIAARNAAIYSGVYKLSTKIERGTNKKGEQTMYGVFIVKNAGWVPKDTPAGAAIFRYAEDFVKNFGDRDITTNREAGDDDFDPAALEAQSTAREEM